MRLVIALGGNALLRRSERADAGIQRQHVRIAAEQLAPVVAGREVIICHGNGPQIGLVRTTAYLAAGADCVYPIALWEMDAARLHVGDRRAVNVTRVPEGPPTGDLAALGMARVSWAIFLHVDAMARFADQLGSLRD